MAERRPIVSAGGRLRQLAPGDTLPKSALPTLTPGDVGADPAGTAGSAVATHLLAADPHLQYTTQDELAQSLDGKVAEAPVDGKAYVRKDAAWVEDSGGGGGLSAEVLLRGVYAGHHGPARLLRILDEGVAVAADLGAMYPTLATTVTAAPRDNVFPRTGATDVGYADSQSTANSSGTGAGLLLPAAAPGFLELSTGSTAAGAVYIQIVVAAEDRISPSETREERMLAEFTIPTLSVSAQAFEFNVSWTSVTQLSMYYTYTHSRAGGALEFNVELAGAEFYSGGVIGPAIVAGSRYVLEAVLTATPEGAQVVHTLTNATAGTVETVTTLGMPAFTPYTAEDPKVLEAYLVKSTGTTARTARVKRLRGLTLT